MVTDGQKDTQTQSVGEDTGARCLQKAGDTWPVLFGGREVRTRGARFLPGVRSRRRLEHIRVSPCWGHLLTLKKFTFCRWDCWRLESVIFSDHLTSVMSHDHAGEQRSEDGSLEWSRG